MSDRKGNVIIVLLVCNLFVLWGLFNYIERENDVLDRSITYVRRSLDDGIDDIRREVRQQNRMIIREDSFLENADIEKKVITSRIEVELKEIKEGTEILVEYIADSNKERVTIPMVNEGNLLFKCERELSINENYTYNIIQRDQNGNRSMLEGYFREFPLKDEYYDSRIYIYGVKESRNNYVEVDSHIDINHFNFEEFKLDKAILEISLEGDSLDIVDVTDMFEKNNNQNQEVSRYDFEYVVKFERFSEELNKLKLPVEALKFKLKVSCKDGQEAERIFE